MFASLILLVSMMLGGCTTPKNIAYMQDLDKTTIELVTSQQNAIRLEPGDKISIVVHSKDPSLAALFNLPVISNHATTSDPFVNGSGTASRSYNSSDGTSSYTISPEGTIDFPVLGILKVAGMTRSELTGFIKGELLAKNLIKDPTVVVEFLSTGVSILGEVKSPGRYDMNRDHINILEAITLAGDLTIQGQRQNVKVIRTEPDGKVNSYIVDLTNAQQLMSSPAFYLKQNDIIYVEPNGVQKRTTTVNGNTALSAGFWVSVASLLTSIAVLIFK
ncbi:MAG: polysaccharide biosynthesis/export family protein [Muribaculaceae bacterium]|nr:polysaccharide biosynthesis/export family protein [Muribaculaceae bacterium]